MDDELRSMLYHLNAGSENDIRKGMADLKRTLQSLWATEREEGGTEPIRVVDDAGNLRFVIAPYSLLEELGVGAYFAALKDDGTTVTFWLDADTGNFMAAGGNFFVNENGAGITEGSAGGKPGQYSPNGVTWYDSSGNAVGELMEYLSAATGYRHLQLQVVVSSDVTNKGMFDLNVLDTSGNIVERIQIDAATRTVTLGLDSSSAVAIPGTLSIGGASFPFVDKTNFTPTIEGTTSAGTGTYTNQLGRYGRIGNVVYFTLDLLWTAHTGTGNLLITGLPLTSENVAVAPCAVYFTDITLAAVGNKVEALVQANSTQIILREIGSGTAAAIPMDTAGRVALSGFYFV